MRVQVAGPLGHYINGWAGHALGQFGKVQPIFGACRGQFGESDQVELVFAGTELICPGITRLLEVRRTIGLRNSAHSIVKLMNPCEGPSLVLASYTHPEYAISMAKTLALTGTNTMLLRGTEGESVADPRRMPAMAGFIRGEQQALESLKHGPLPTTVELPADVDVDTTVRYIQGALNGTQQVPTSIARQIEHIVQMCSSI